jgi:polyhydroxybutyrate depolymerase
MGARMRVGGIVAALVVLAGVASACVPPSVDALSAFDGVDLPTPSRQARPSAACATDARPPTSRQVWNFAVDGESRIALVDAPDAAEGDPLPVVLSFHGFSQTAEAYDGLTDMSVDGVARGYVVVTPQGSTALLGLPRWIQRGGFPGPDDVGFVDRIVERLGGSICVDLSRIYATGFSAGSSFTSTLTCDRPGLLAAVASSSGTNLSVPCPDAPPANALLIHGDLDPIAPLAGQTFIPPTGISVRSVFESYTARGRCDGSETIEVTSSVHLVRATGCSDGGDTAWLRLGDAGHTWAGKTDFLALRALVGPTNLEIDATATVLDWFDSH